MAVMTTRWYEDKKMLQAAYEQFGTLAKAAEALGGADPTTLVRWWKRHKLYELPKGPHPSSSPVNEEALKQLHESIYGKRS